MKRTLLAIAALACLVRPASAQFARAFAHPSEGQPAYQTTLGIAPTPHNAGDMWDWQSAESSGTVTNRTSDIQTRLDALNTNGGGTLLFTDRQWAVFQLVVGHQTRLTTGKAVIRRGDGFSETPGTTKSLIVSRNLSTTLDGYSSGAVYGSTEAGYKSHATSSTLVTGSGLTVDDANDEFDYTSHGEMNNHVAQISSTGSLPTSSPQLAAATDYYLVNKTDNDFQLATTPDGTPITMSDSGSGTITITIQPPDGGPHGLISDGIDYYGGYSGVLVENPAVSSHTTAETCHAIDWHAGGCRVRNGQIMGFAGTGIRAAYGGGARSGSPTPADQQRGWVIDNMDIRNCFTGIDLIDGDDHTLIDIEMGRIKGWCIHVQDSGANIWEGRHHYAGMDSGIRVSGSGRQIMDGMIEMESFRNFAVWIEPNSGSNTTIDNLQVQKNGDGATPFNESGSEWTTYNTADSGLSGDTGTDTWTYANDTTTGTGHVYDNQIVTVTGSDDISTGYVVNSDQDAGTFQLSDTRGGSADDITDVTGVTILFQPLGAALVADYPVHVRSCYIKNQSSNGFVIDLDWGGCTLSGTINATATTCDGILVDSDGAKIVVDYLGNGNGSTSFALHVGKTKTVDGASVKMHFTGTSQVVQIENIGNGNEFVFSGAGGTINIEDDYATFDGNGNTIKWNRETQTVAWGATIVEP